MHKMYESAVVIAAIDPDSVTTGTVSSDEVDMRDFHDLMIIIQTGDMESSATLNGTLVSGSATGTTTTTVKTITELTDNDDDKQVVMYVRGDQLTANHRYVKLNLVVTGTVEQSAVILGRPRYAVPTDLASVDEYAQP